MYRPAAAALVAAAVVIQSGCVLADPRHQLRPPPPSEGLRAQLGRVALSAGPSETAAVLEGPAREAGQGAARGALFGAAWTTYGGAHLGGWGAFVGILLAPVGALVGAVVGADRAESAAKVEQQETLLTGSLQELQVPEALRGCIADRLREERSTPAERGGSEEPTTILEVTVERVGLQAPVGIKPPLTFVLTERTRLLRASDGTELYVHWLTYRGRTRPIEAWLAENSAMLREDVGRACRVLAEEIVDEVFLLYLPGSERSGRR
jgi:hypothetical protein